MDLRLDSTEGLRIAASTAFRCGSIYGPSTKIEARKLEYGHPPTPKRQPSQIILCPCSNLWSLLELPDFPPQTITAVGSYYKELYRNYGTIWEFWGTYKMIGFGTVVEGRPDALISELFWWTSPSRLPLDRSTMQWGGMPIHRMALVNVQKMSEDHSMETCWGQPPIS